MDLRSLEANYEGRERYHPFAALIEVGNEVVEDNDELLLMGPMPIEQYLRISKIFHEITHVASLRTTRLGFWIARVSSELLERRSTIPSKFLYLPSQVQILIGAYAPILEGLALYAQLDYDVHDVDAMLPFPLNKIAVNNTAGWLQGDSTEQVARNARRAAIWDGILHALFIDDQPGTSHYRAGYLYVKAVVAKITRLAPALSDPTTILPLLVRLLCDHPIIERALNEPLSAVQIAQELHDTVTNLDQVKLGRIEQMLTLPEIRERFDNWDIHSQLKAVSESPPIFHSMSNPLFRGFRNDEMFVRFRGATDSYLTSWAGGIPVSTKFEDGYVHVRLRDGPRTVTAKIMVHSVFNAFRRNMTPESLETLGKLEEIMLSRFKWAKKQKHPIAVGSYLTLTKGAIGTVFWIDNVLCGVIPLSLVDNRLDPDEARVALTGNALSPAFRKQLIRKIRRDDAGTLDFAILDSSEALFASLISDPNKRELGLYGGLGILLPSALRQTFNNWCTKLLAPGGPENLDPSVAMVLTEVFDRAGIGAGAFDELLPNLES